MDAFYSRKIKSCKMNQNQKVYMLVFVLTRLAVVNSMKKGLSFATLQRNLPT